MDRPGRSGGRSDPAGSRLPRPGAGGAGPGWHRPVTAPPAVMLPDGATDMSGSTLAAILIPPAGTICLVVWLAVVFYTGRDPAPGRQSPGTAARTSRRQADARRADRGAWR